MDAKSAISKTYDSCAAEYQERLKKQKVIKKETTRILLKYLQPKSRVIDIGCGVGYDVLMLSKKCEAYGIDISPEMAKRARQRNKNATIILGDFLRYRFVDKFDGIFSNAFIHLFPTGIYEKVLREMHRILTTNGVAYISTTRERRSREGWYRKKDYRSKAKRFRKYWTKTELSKALIELGFTIVKYFEMTDPFGKRFMNFIVRKK